METFGTPQEIDLSFHSSFEGDSLETNFILSEIRNELQEIKELMKQNLCKK